MGNQIPINFRTLETEDESFIYNSWLKSFRNSPLAKPLCNEVYFRNHKLIINNILQRSTTLLACNPEDSSQIYGYIVYEMLRGVPIVHYVYTKYTYRKLGIAKQLFEATIKSKPLLISHYTSNLKPHMDKLELIFDPYKM